MENRKHILSAEELKAYVRPISRHVEDEDVETFIRECEDTVIIPAIGLKRFKELCCEENQLGDENKILLCGGEYENRKGELKQCVGLKAALSYFTYAKMMMSDGTILTRTGLMQHNDSYAERSDDKNRVRRYNDVMNVAEEYLSTCLAYLASLNKGRCENSEVGKVRGTRLRIHAIGD